MELFMFSTDTGASAAININRYRFSSLWVFIKHGLYTIRSNHFQYWNDADPEDHIGISLRSTLYLDCINLFL